MSCNKQTVAAAICEFIEDVSGEKVTQADWHGLVRRAEEEGYAVGRKRLNIHNTITSLRGLGESEGNSAAAESALAKVGYTDEGRAGMSIEAVDGKFPTYTQNMAAVVQLMKNNGVKETLKEVQAKNKSQKNALITDSEITQRIGTPSSSLGAEYMPYTFNLHLSDGRVISDNVAARSDREAKRTVNEYAARFLLEEGFASDVNKAPAEDSEVKRSEP